MSPLAVSTQHWLRRAQAAIHRHPRRVAAAVLTLLGHQDHVPAAWTSPMAQAVQRAAAVQGRELFGAAVGTYWSVGDDDRSTLVACQPPSMLPEWAEISSRYC